MSGISSLAKDFESKSKRQAQSLQEALTAELHNIEQSLKKESELSAKRIRSVIQKNENALSEQLDEINQSRVAAAQEAMSWMLIATIAIVALSVVLIFWLFPMFQSSLSAPHGIEIVEEGVTQEGTPYVIIQNPTRQIQNNQTVIFLPQE